MKIKKVLKIKMVAKLLVWIIRTYTNLLFRVCKVHVHVDKQAQDYLNGNQVWIFSAWHSRIFIFPEFLYKGVNFSAVISSHGDGEVLSHLMASYGFKTIRGSSRHNSFSAMSGMIRAIKAGHNIAITPDGPIGPRFKIKGNIVEFANRFSIPIIPFSYSASHAKVLKTWDRFIIPIPFLSEIYIEIGKPISPSVKKNENSQKELEEIMMAQVQQLDSKAQLKIDYQV